MEKNNNSVTRKDDCSTYSMKCPVCSNWVDFFDICENCGYQNQGINVDNGLRGPNKMTLTEAKEAYKDGREIY